MKEEQEEVPNHECMSRRHPCEVCLVVLYTCNTSTR